MYSDPDGHQEYRDANGNVIFNTDWVTIGSNDYVNDRMKQARFAAVVQSLKQMQQTGVTQSNPVSSPSTKTTNGSIIDALANKLAPAELKNKGKTQFNPTPFTGIEYDIKYLIDKDFARKVDEDKATDWANEGIVYGFKKGIADLVNIPYQIAQSAHDSMPDYMKNSPNIMHYSLLDNPVYIPTHKQANFDFNQDTFTYYTGEGRAIFEATFAAATAAGTEAISAIKTSMYLSRGVETAGNVVRSVETVSKGTSSGLEFAGGTQEFVADLSHVTGKSSVARNRAIQAAIKEDLPNLNLVSEPVYSPFAKTGIAKQGNINTQIGKEAFSSRSELTGTILHEELHQRWWKRGIPSYHHSPNEYIHGEPFYKVLERYKRMRGWDYSKEILSEPSSTTLREIYSSVSK